LIGKNQYLQNLENIGELIREKIVHLKIGRFLDILKMQQELLKQEQTVMKSAIFLEIARDGKNLK